MSVFIKKPAAKKAAAPQPVAEATPAPVVKPTVRNVPQSATPETDPALQAWRMITGRK